MKTLIRGMKIVGWILVIGELLFLIGALMSPTAVLPWPLDGIYDGLVALFGGYRAGGALRLWITAVTMGVGLVIVSAVLKKRMERQ